MATHSSILAWRIPWTEEPGELQSMGSQRVENDRADFFLSLCLGYILGLPRWLRGKESTCQCRHQTHGLNPWVGKIPWRRKWQPTPVFLPGESHGQRSLVRSMGSRESDTNERLSTSIEYTPTFDISDTHTHTHTSGQNKDTKGQPVNHTIVRDIFVHLPTRPRPKGAQ